MGGKVGRGGVEWTCGSADSRALDAEELTSDALRERRLSGWSKGGLLSCSFSK